jgi:hypothetical protein
MPCASSVANWLERQPFPPELRKVWLGSLVEEILEVRVISSRGRTTPRGVKRKMSGYPLRRVRGPTRRRKVRVQLRRSEPSNLSEQYWG